MLTALLAFALVPAQETATLTLAADCYIDHKAPKSNTGREPLLKAGPEKAVLIRFPELGLSVGAGKRVLSARIEFVLGQPGVPKLTSIGRVLKPWGEGGWRADQFGVAKPPIALAAATWNDALAGKDGIGWDRGGASGRGDSEAISGAEGKVEGDNYSISGITKAVQAMVDDPQHNFGLRLEFEGVTILFSADSLGYGPKLFVEFAPGATDAAPDLRVVSCEPVGVDLTSPPSDGQTVQWRAVVRNAGDVDSRSQTLTVESLGKEIVSTKLSAVIAVGETKGIEFKAPWRAASASPAMQPLTVRVVPEESERNPSDNGLTVYPGGIALYVEDTSIEVAQSEVTDLNERVFPFSKFGAWPMGCTERLRIVSDPKAADLRVTASGGLRRAILQAAACLPDSLIRPYAGEAPVVNGLTAATFVSDKGQAGLLPDTRDDVIVPQGLPIPDSGSTSLILGDLVMAERKMLSRSEVTILNALVGKRGAARELPWDMVPSHVLFRVFTPDGLTPTGAKLEVYQLVGGAFGSQAVFAEDVGPDGAVFMQGRPGGAFGKSNPFGDLKKDGSNGWLLAVVRANDTSSSTWIPVWQLWDEYARGNQAAAFVELRVQVSSGLLDRSEDLALNRVATDSKGRFPAQLSALTDGKEETSVAFGKEGDGYWIEVDMGRDRQIGEVTLVFDGAPWKQFRIVTYKTAQSPNDGLVWSEESNGPASPNLVKTAGGKTSLSYLSKSVRSRYLRIVPFSGEDVKLAEVKVVPIRSD